MFERTRAAFRAFFAADDRLEQRFSSTGPIVVAGRTGSAVYSPWSAEKFASEGYAANVIAFLCIRLVSDAFASLPLLCFRGEREVPGHALAALLDRPNPLQGQDRFLQALAIYHLISGNSFVEAVRSGRRTPPRELYNLNPNRMKIVAGPAGLPGAYRFEEGGKRRDYPVDPVRGYGDVLHLREPNPLLKGEEYGFSPTQAAGRWLDLDNSGADRRIQHSSGTDPDVAFMFEDITTQDQLDLINFRLKDRWEDSRRAQSPLAMAGKVQVAKLGQSLREMQWTEGMDAAARRICAAWNVPHVLVVPGESTYANREMAHLELWEHTVLPFARLMLGDLVPWFRFLFQDDGLDLRIDEDGISALEPRRATIRETSLLAFEKGLLSLNEARLVWGYEPAVESDDPAEEPAALRNARQATMLAEAQQEALRNPEEQQGQRPGLDDSEDEEEDEEERAETRSHQPWQDQGRVPAGEEGAGRFAANALSQDAFRRWLLTGRKSGEPFPPELKSEADDEARDFAETIDDETLADEMAIVILATIQHFGQRTFAQLGVEIAFDIHDERVVRFLREFGADRVKGLIGETTRAELAEELAKAFEQGSRYDEIVSAIRRVMGNASQSRAEAIATTESTRAVGWATQTASEQAGVERRAWLSSRDAFVRDVHRSMDGQVRPIGEAFEAGGYRAMYPGGFGIGSQDIRCRCVLIPIPDEKSIETIATKEARDVEWKTIADEAIEFEKRLIEATRAGLAAQERRLVVEAYRRYGR